MLPTPALVSVSSIATAVLVVGMSLLLSSLNSREIPKNGSGARNWGNPKDVKQQLYSWIPRIILSADETQEIEQSPMEEEVVEEPRPVVFYSLPHP